MRPDPRDVSLVGAERLERELVPDGLWALVKPLTDRGLTQLQAAGDAP